VPGYRRNSRAIHGVAETLIVNGYVIPIVFLNPCIAGGVFADYLARGRYQLVPKNPIKVDAGILDALTEPLEPLQPGPATPSLVLPASVSEGANGVARPAGSFTKFDATISAPLR